MSDKQALPDQLGLPQRPAGLRDGAVPGPRAATVKFLIRDRAGHFTSSFDAVFTAGGVRILASPPQALRANAICVRVMGALRREVLDRLLIVNERPLLTGYLRHYNTTRPHRSLSQLTPAQADSHPPDPVSRGHVPLREDCWHAWPPSW